MKLKRAQEKQKNTCINALCLLNKIQVVDLFYNAIKKKHPEVIRKNGGLVIESKSVMLYFCFSFDSVSKTDVVRAFNAMPKGYVLYLFADNFSAEITHFINRFNKKIIMVDGAKAYELLKETDLLPKSEIDFSNKKPNFLHSIKGLGQRKNAKRYLSFGAIFLFMSYFVPIKLYYIIVGCLFLIFALFCRLFGKVEKKN